MADKLHLLNADIPLQIRYDKYLEWESQNSTVSLQVVAQNLEIRIAYVEVFVDLGKLDEEEFNIIDDCKINIDSLVLITKEEKPTREKIYSNYNIIISNTNEPLKALRNFIDGDNEPLFREKLERVSPEAYFKIAQYLKQVGIEQGTITKQFRGLLVSVGKRLQNEETVSDPQIDWIVRAITFSNIHTLNVFSNELLETDFPDDYLIFQEIVEIIENTHV